MIRVEARFKAVSVEFVNCGKIELALISDKTRERRVDIDDWEDFSACKETDLDVGGCDGCDEVREAME